MSERSPKLPSVNMRQGRLYGQGVGEQVALVTDDASLATRAAKRLADTRYTYEAYLQRTREACAALASIEARPIVEGRVA